MTVRLSQMTYRLAVEKQEFSCGRRLWHFWMKRYRAIALRWVVGLSFSGLVEAEVEEQRRQTDRQTETNGGMHGKETQQHLPTYLHPRVADLEFSLHVIIVLANWHCDDYSLVSHSTVSHSRAEIGRGER
ncbi:hypothetical protein LY78DRAFT_658127 [Colletotrichum sublineola]|nr:hypothetical protein LY78DRAFT_658127 [Colletotrichum sublineola]